LRIDPHNIDSRDMHVDIVRHFHAVHLGPEHRILKDEVLWDDAGFQDLAPAINVANVVIYRLHALLETAAHDLPFVRCQDPRQHVERDKPLLRIRIAIDSEGDTDAAE
jgi:hypothetical protein